MKDDSTGNAADLRLAGAAAAGALPAWHEFVLRYSNLILATVRRYMAGFDADDHRTVYVDILAHMHREGLRRYDGSITLASWVIVLARNRCLDAVRAQWGRKRPPAWLRAASPFDAAVYHLFHVDGLDVAAVVGELERRGHAGVDSASVFAALDRLDARISSSLRTQLAYELQARSVGRTAARLLEHADEVRRHVEAAQNALRPDILLIEKEAQSLAARVQKELGSLPEDVRRAVQLRYVERCGADETASRLGLRNRGSAHRLLRRAIEHLRRALMATDADVASAAAARRAPSGGRARCREED